MVLGGAFGAEMPGPDRAVEALWNEQQIQFAYRGDLAAHTCAGLSAQLRSFLRLLGAREDMRISVRGCDDPTTTRVVSITLASPVEATPQIVTELTSHDTRSELVARVRGEDLATADTLRRFPAVWRSISFSNALRGRFTLADCELLEQVRNKVMPKLAIRIVSDRLRCSSIRGGSGRPALTVAALVPGPDARIGV